MYLLNVGKILRGLSH